MSEQVAGRGCGGGWWRRGVGAGEGRGWGTTGGRQVAWGKGGGGRGQRAIDHEAERGCKW